MRKWILIFLFSSAASASTTPSSFFSNRKGVDELKKSNPAAAQEQFLSSLAKNPFEAKLHLNLGLTYEVLGQADKAQASYETALKLAKDDVTRFAANFNMGELAQKAQKTDEALKYYQEALKYNPESRETKVNIELLIQDQQGKGKNQDKDQKQDPKDQNKDGKGQGQDKKDQKDQKDDQGKDDQQKDGKQDQPKKYGKNKPQPRKFKSEELSQGDVNKILGEIKQQEQKIRADFNKKDVKESPRDKDW